MSGDFKYTDEFFKEFEEKYMPKPREDVKAKTTFAVKKPKRRFKLRYFCLLVMVVLIITLIICFLPKKDNSQTPSDNVEQEEIVNTNTQVNLSPYKEPTINTKKLTDDVNSNFAVLISADTGEILAEKNLNAKMYPASLTKVMTLLVALENVTDLNDTFEMSYTIIDPLYRQGASLAGFSSGEAVKILDLLYGVILPSGADATCGIATYVSGSEDAFVKLMNNKVKELGLENTHFANSSGLYDDNNYTTAYDMALILKAAMKNELALKILSTSQYTTSKTLQHPEGVWMDSTLSHYISGNKLSNGSAILGGKTGYVSESGNCIATFGKSATGNNYIMVTGKAESGKKAAQDHMQIYSKLAN